MNFEWIFFVSAKQNKIHFRCELNCPWTSLIFLLEKKFLRVLDFCWWVEVHTQTFGFTITIIWPFDQQQIYFVYSIWFNESYKKFYCCCLSDANAKKTHLIFECFIGWCKWCLFFVLFFFFGFKIWRILLFFWNLKLFVHMMILLSIFFQSD